MKSKNWNSRGWPRAAQNEYNSKTIGISEHCQAMLEHLYRVAAIDYDRKKKERDERSLRHCRWKRLVSFIARNWRVFSSCVNWPIVFGLAALGEAIVVILAAVV